ncbi:amino acid ABC transporter permease [Mesorhizobium sp. J428]|uniref:amino acid ABC transporter permease n=1 Tax=Mesorhizobium sp. J428 TaxID=2898440 RepID=UPI002150DDE3|nr:amino acid ABC transporter permease [Mesorhizobium sp. J428]MCR5857214.1 amino acid ABC transporter permease [Mesorhizobium sp. J428]
MSFDWGVIYLYRYELLLGLQNTVMLVVVAMVLGVIAGAVACFGRLLGKGPMFWLSTFYVNTFRAIPETVLVFWIYFCGPFIFTFKPNAWDTGILSMSLVAGAYFAEIARAGIQSVSRGQWEAGRALGISEFWLWTDIVIPQAVRAMLPASALLVTNLVKMSGLVSVVGVAELIYQAQTLGSLRFRYFEFFTVVAIIYFLLIFPFSMASRAIEAHLDRRK